MARDGLRLVSGGAKLSRVRWWRPTPPFPGCVPGGLCVSQVARGFSPITMENGAGWWTGFLVACGRPAWEVTRDDVDRVVAELDHSGLGWPRLAVATCRPSRGSTRFLVARKAAEIEGLFGVRLVDRWTSSTQPAMSARTHHQLTPAKPRSGWRSSSSYLKGRIADSAQIHRRGSGLRAVPDLVPGRAFRAEESASMDQCGDVPLWARPVRQAARRFGKGAQEPPGRGRRWVPMLYGLDLILRLVYRGDPPPSGRSPGLFCDEGGGRIHRGTIRNRLAYLLDLEQVSLGEGDGGPRFR